jgi:uncharacterized membrane protein YqiK
MGVLILFLVLAIALIAGPIAASIIHYPLSGLTSVIMSGSGIGLAVISGILIIITRLYVKTKANEALVKTGMGGMRVVKDGGAIIIPVIHELVIVRLNTIKLEMTRQGADALITSDKLRADVSAQFYVKVQPNDEDIQAAARTFGNNIHDAAEVAKLVEDKLISALRTIAAKKTLEELNSDRDTFVAEVTKVVTSDLKHNGLTLESVTISRLDQTDPAQLHANNVFNAQGLTAIEEIVQKKQTERNQLIRTGEQTRAEQDVQTKKKLLDFEREQAEAQAKKDAQILIAQAEQHQSSEQKRIEAEQVIALRNVDKTKATEVATRAQQQAVEVADREKQAAVADAEAKLAKAAQAKAVAEALAETARQSITTVQTVATADREQQKKVIEAKATAETTYVTTQRAADGDAYALKANAEGRKAAAEADALAITTKAQAESDAAKRRAEGAQAEQMVPITVKKAEVDVEQRRVEVLQQELKAREDHGATAQEFEVAKLRVSKEAEVRIEAARATATLVGKIEGKVFGTHEDVARMVHSFMSGMGISNTAEGFLGGAGPATQTATAGAISALTDMVKGLADRLGGNAKDAGSSSTPPATAPTADAPATE